MTTDIRQNLVGHIETEQSLVGSIETKHYVDGLICADNYISGNLNIGVIIERLPDYYEGEYEITPKLASQIMATKLMLMKDDVTINKIPAYEVTNSSGGTTFTIGKDV